MNGNINTHLFTEYSAGLKTFCSISDGIAERLLLSSSQTGEKRAGAISKGIVREDRRKAKLVFKAFGLRCFMLRKQKTMNLILCSKDFLSVATGFYDLFIFDKEGVL